MLLTLALLISNPVPVPLNGCAWIRAENDGAGAGFVVDVEKRLLITCRHVVADRKKVDVFFPWKPTGELVTNRKEYLRNRDTLSKQKRLVTGTVLKTADELDLALVQLDALPSDAHAVTFSTCAPQPGEALHVIGHRLDLDTVWNITTGPLRATGRLTDGYFWRGKKLATNAQVLIGQLPIEEGDSGGPVVNSRGELVGMVSALRRQCPLAAVCISSDPIQQFVNVIPTPAKSELSFAEMLMRATVWVKPTTTDVHIAGVLIEKNLVLTCAHGLREADRVGVALPLRDGERWISERESYRDPLTLYLRGAWRSGIVLARDSARDLALIQLDSGCEYMKPVSISEKIPKPGDSLHSMNHPGGLEFAWMYSGGSIRQRGKIALALGENTTQISALVCQLPTQAGSPGGPVLNAGGKLVGVLSAREGAQMVGYCADADEIRAFLEVARPDQPVHTLAGLQARITTLSFRYISTLAHGLAERGESARQSGRFAEAKRDCDNALSLDAGCVAAYLCRARMLSVNAALAELDIAVENGPFHRDALVFRARLSADTKDWRKARGDLERVLDVFPADAEARQQLTGVQFALGEDAKAANAIRDTLRADPSRLPAIATTLLAQSDTLKQKYPDIPSIPADWLTRALTAAADGTPDAKAKAAIKDLLKTASTAKDDTERLSVLRGGVKKLK